MHIAVVILTILFKNIVLLTFTVLLPVGSMF